MAPDSCFYRNFCINSLSSGNNKVASNLLSAFTKSSGFSISIACTFSQSLFLGFALAFIPAFVVFSTNNKLFKKFLKAFLAAQS